MQSTTMAVDLAKSVFEVAVSTRPGRIERRRRLTRGQFRRLLRDEAPGRVIMEACGTAHFWGREAAGLGHQVTLLPPHAVRPYVVGNKTDRADAKGLLEALRNEAIRPVPVKSLDQHVLASLHRLRSAWMATRTARLNTLRGLLRELGLPIPQGSRRVVPAVHALLGDADSGVPEALHPILLAAAQEIPELEARVREAEGALEAIAGRSELIARLRTIPGVGKILALTILYEIHDVHRFDRVQQFASYARLVKCAAESAGKKGTSGAKMGNVHLKWAFSEAAVMFVRHSPEGKKALARLEKPLREGQGPVRPGPQARAGRLLHAAARKGLRSSALSRDDDLREREP